MTDLLVEVWEDELGQTMGPVLEFNDVRRPAKGMVVHSFRARSWMEAQHLYDRWCGVDCVLQDDVFVEPFTDEERRIQDEYLSRRQARK